MNFKVLKSYYKMLPLCLPFLLYVLLSWCLLGKPQLCLFRAICGYPCPGCGLSHAGWYLITLRLADSFRSHALFLPMVATLIVAVLPPEFSPVVAKLHRQTWWYILLGVMMTAYFVFRIVMYYPGEYPMCYEEQNFVHLLFGRIF